MEKSTVIFSTPDLEKVRIWILVFLAFIFGLELSAQDTTNVPPSAIHQNNENDFVPDEIIVQFTTAVAEQLKQTAQRGATITGLKQIDALNSKHGVKSIEKAIRFVDSPKTNVQLAEKYGLSRIYVLKLQKGSDVQRIAEEYENNPDVVFAEPNFIDYLTTVPNDPTYSLQWGLKNTGQAISYTNTVVGTPGADINIEPAWTLHTGDENVIIAIIDTGLDYLHPEFAGRVVPGYDIYNNDNDPMDDGNHGTACAGIAAASGNNGIGVAGVNWNCKIMPVKIFPAIGGTSTENVANGIIWAANNGADVLSCSFGGSSASDLRLNAVNYAYDLGCTIIASRGNANNSLASYPASYSNVIAVGALSPCNDRKTPLTCDGETSWGSSYGNDLDVMAPGTRIHTTDRLGSAGYSTTDYTATFNGTSAACPFVAGVAALICSYAPNLSNAEIADVLTMTAVDIATPGFDDQTGYGCVDAFAALNLAAIAQKPEITVSTNIVSFSIYPDENDNEIITISNILGADVLPLYWDISYNSVSNPWLTLSKSSGRILAGGSDQVQINVNSFDMSDGDYSCTLDINSNDPDNPVVQVVVNLEVLYNPPPVAVISPPEMWFALSVGQTASKTISVLNGASPGDRNLHWNASVHGPNLSWISLNAISGVTAPGITANVQVTVNTAGLAAGVYQDTVVVTTNDPANPLVRIPVQLTLSFPLVKTAKILICVSGTTYYGGSSPDIKAFDLDGTNPISLFIGHQQPVTGAIDNVNKKFYWIDWSAGNSILRGDLDGSNKETVLSGLGTPNAVAVDGQNGYIYYIETNYPNRRIQRANLDGSNVVTILGMTGQNANGLSLDIANGKMYWCEGFHPSNPEGVWRANLDGTSPVRIIATVSDPFGLALDLEHGKIYWGETYPDDIIKKANLDGTGIENVVTTNSIRSLAIDVTGGKIYWSDSGWDGSTYLPYIARANLNGTGMETILTSTSLLFPRITLDLNTDVNCPTELTVNHPGDEPDANPGDGICATADGYCTLRAAVMEANALSQCSPLSINFSITGTINLATTLPNLTHPNLTITGPGADQLTVQRSFAGGTPEFRIFTIPVGKTVEIAGLTINNGYGNNGGAIQNSGNLTVNQCTLSNNFSGSNGGGGIGNFGILQLNGSMFINNSASFAGGGLLQINGGTTTAIGCRLTGNTAPQGGAIGNQGMSVDAQMSFTNCIIEGNSSGNGSALINIASGANTTLSLLNCTVAGNTGSSAINCGSNSGPVSLTYKNSIFDNPGFQNFVGSGLTSLGNNISSDGTGNLIALGDKPNTNPLFVSAADYHLQPCSPAINAGTNTGAPADDLDGNTRPYNPYSFGTAIVDIGAYEYSSPVDYCSTCEVAAVAGSLTKGPDEIAVCEGDDVSALLTAGTGGNGIDSLAYRTNDGSSWSGWANYTSGTTIPTTVLTAVEIHTQRLSTHCDASEVVTVSWNVDPTTVGGAVTGASNITYGSSTGNLTLSGQTGSVVKWQKKLEIGGSWEDIVNSSDVYSESPTSSGTWYYRAQVQSGVCSEEYSQEHAVNVGTKELTIGGSFTANDKIYDDNTDATFDQNNLTLEGIVGSDEVLLTGLEIDFASKTPGTHDVSITNASLDGADKDNYTLSLTGSPETTATIDAGPPVKFLVTNPDGGDISSPKLHNIPFDVKVTLVDVYDNPTPNTGGEATVTLTGSGGATPGELHFQGFPSDPVTMTLPSGDTLLKFNNVLYTGVSDIAGFDVKVSASATGTGTANGKTGESNLFSVRDIFFMVDASPTSIQADGTSKSDITVTLQDHENGPLAGQTITVETDKGTLFDGSTEITGVGTFVTDANGQVFLQLRASTTSVVATVTAKCPGACPKTAEVAFLLSAPVITGFTPGEDEATMDFTPPGNVGTDAITNYEYSLNDGSDWTPFSPAQTTSPVTISGLTGGQTYPARLRAVNEAGTGEASDAYTIYSCYNPTDGGTIAADQDIVFCDQPAELTSQTGASGNFGTLEYQWQQSTTSETEGFSDIPGANSANYQPDALTDTTWFRRLARVSCKSDWTGAVSSNVVKLTLTFSQTIHIPKGWSYISSWLEPTNPNIINLWQEVVGANNLVILTGTAGIYAPPPLYINTLQTWDVDKGYKVKMNHQDDLVIDGRPLDDKSVTFPAGVHLIPVLTNQTTPLDEAFSNPANDILYLLDIYTNQVYWPDGQINTLTELVPGKGYLANFKNQVTLSYPELGDCSKSKGEPMPPADGPWPVVRTSGIHLISVSAEAMNGLQNADYIGAFDSQGNCVGYVPVEKSGKNLLLTVYGDEPITAENDGLMEGELLRFRSFSLGDNAEKELTATFNPTFPNADGLFYINGLSGISGFKESSTGLGENNLAASVEIYPNPAKDMLNITLTGFKTLSGLKKGITATLLTAEGKVVKTFSITSPTTQLDVADLQTGIYLLKITSENQIVVKRLVKQ